MAQCNDCLHKKVCLHIANIQNDTDPYMGINYDTENCNHFMVTDVVPKSEEGAECPTCHGTGRIGTTNWLTKNISKKQLAEEKAKAIAAHEQYIKTEYAREIFEEIEKYWIKSDTLPDCARLVDLDKIAELKKKYERNEECSFSSPLIPSNDILFLSSVFQVLGVEGEVQFNGDTVTIGYATKHGTVCAHFSKEVMRKYYNRVSAFLTEVL